MCGLITYHVSHLVALVLRPTCRAVGTPATRDVLPAGQRPLLSRIRSVVNVYARHQLLPNSLLLYSAPAPRHPHPISSPTPPNTQRCRRSAAAADRSPPLGVHFCIVLRRVRRNTVYVVAACSTHASTSRACVTRTVTDLLFLSYDTFRPGTLSYTGLAAFVCMNSTHSLLKLSVRDLSLQLQPVFSFTLTSLRVILLSPLTSFNAPIPNAPPTPSSLHHTHLLESLSEIQDP